MILNYFTLVNIGDAKYRALVPSVSQTKSNVTNTKSVTHLCLMRVNMPFQLGVLRNIAWGKSFLPTVTSSNILESQLIVKSVSGISSFITVTTLKTTIIADFVSKLGTK
jgi:hypothetical protein